MSSNTSQPTAISENSADSEALEQLPFTAHLVELRRCLIKCIGLIIALFMLMLPLLSICPPLPISSSQIVVL